MEQGREREQARICQAKYYETVLVSSQFCPHWDAIVFEPLHMPILVKGYSMLVTQISRHF